MIADQKIRLIFIRRINDVQFKIHEPQSQQAIEFNGIGIKPATMIEISRPQTPKETGDNK